MICSQPESVPGCSGTRNRQINKRCIRLMRKETFLILGAGVTFPLLAGIAGCNFKSRHGDVSAAEAPSAKVAAAGRGDIAHTLSLAGSVPALSGGGRSPQGHRLHGEDQRGYRRQGAQGPDPGGVGSSGVECAVEGYRLRDAAGQRRPAARADTKSSGPRLSIRRFMPTISGCSKRRRRNRV